MEKKYLIGSIIINLLFYALIFSASFSKNQGPLFNPLILFAELLIINFFLSLFGWRLLKKYSGSKYIWLGFIINVAPVVISLVYSIIFLGIEPAFYGK